MPTMPTLNSFLPVKTQNAFYALTVEDDSEDESSHGQGKCCESGSCKSVNQLKREATRRARDDRRVEQWGKASSQTQLDLLTDPEYKNEPNPNTPPGVNVIDYLIEEDDAIMLAEDEVEVDVAMDSGSVAHVIKPGDVPAGVEVGHKPGERVQDFVNASGGGMRNYGKAQVEMVQEDGKTFGSTLNVTDVTRALHSTSTVCDNAGPSCPDGHEVLFTKGVCTVVPDGALSQFLGQVRQVAHYPRNGGLWVAKMKLRRPKIAPRTTSQRPSPKRSASGFGGRGAKR